jgi:hypothetical protein
MKVKERLDLILKALKRKDDTLSLACINSISNHTILFQPGFESERSHLYDVYKTRLHFAQNVRKDKFNEEDLKYWERALGAIENKDDKTLVLSGITDDEYAYLIFLVKDLSKVITIIRLTNVKSFAESERYYDDLIQSKHEATVSTVKFSKGEFVKDWKESGA